MELLGKQVKDKITDFEGIATSKHIYLTGCNQYGIQPKVDKDGKVPSISYFDEGRLEVIGEGISAESVKSEENGCDFREHP
jgi:hypothetical protein